MVTLSIDTAGNFCAAALNDAATGKLLSAVSYDIGRGHAEILMRVIDEALIQADLEYQNVDKVVTTLGPGSFTGVRVGISTARAIGLGLSKPVVGVSVLRACAQHATQLDNARFAKRIVSVILDARREEYYFQPLREGKPIKEATVCNIEELVNFHEDFRKQDVVLCGSGAVKFLQHWMDFRPTVDFPIAHHLAAAPIENIAELGRNTPVGKTRPEPLYLRGVDAKQQRGFAILRAESQDATAVS
ncbi:MAG: tRNA (adenosine(37)-N6)-threonylcarbamoyltransferase complex dimerization subunit type 1 TsaB [Hyphomicrobiales bacterium]|nr:tRNA (adenosine(37)-N6)-threonylcarbamoyltransferase complex dimerization subunit type 1 TsaB [Hyphomicrobiales bacterium]